MHGVTPAILEALCDITIEPRDEHMIDDIINDHGTFLTSPKKVSGGLLGLNRLIIDNSQFKHDALATCSKGSHTYIRTRINRNSYIFNTLQSNTYRIEPPVAHHLWVVQYMTIVSMFLLNHVLLMYHIRFTPRFFSRQLKISVPCDASPLRPRSLNLSCKGKWNILRVIQFCDY